MKQFHELTQEQKDKALAIAKKAADECIEAGMFVYDKPMNDGFRWECALAMAEYALYRERFDTVIEGVV